jgi:diguanylate cyclase (GGDEF)-like protein
MRIQLGQRLSGWVAANRQTISNSDAALDLGDIDLGITLKSCMSSALVADDTLVGVLTFYSPEPNGFDEDHRRIIEATGRQIASALKNATTFDGSFHNRESLSGLPFLSHVQQFVDVTGPEHLDQTSSFALVLIGIIGLDRITVTYGRGTQEIVLGHVMRHAASCLRSVDILLRHGNHEFVALLNETSHEAATTVAHRIRDTIRQNPLPIREDVSITVDVSVSNIASLGEGRSLVRLIDDAKSVNLDPAGTRRISALSIAAKIDS